MKKILNKSKAGKSAQDYLKKKLKDETKKFDKEQAELKKEEIDKRIELEDEQVIQILQRMIKQRKDSYTQFSDAGRDEVAEKEQNEIGILSNFLPEQLSEEELNAMVMEAIKETEADGPQDMGKVMGSLKQKIQGNADMGLVSKIVKDNLTA